MTVGYKPCNLGRGIQSYKCKNGFVKFVLQQNMQRIIRLKLVKTSVCLKGKQKWTKNQQQVAGEQGSKSGVVKVREASK